MQNIHNFDSYPDILNADQLSSLLGVSIRTVYKLISEKRIGCIKVGRAYKIPKKNIEKFLYVD